MKDSPCSYNPLLDRKNDSSFKQIYIESSNEFDSLNITEKWSVVFSKFLNTVYKTLKEYTD